MWRIDRKKLEMIFNEGFNCGVNYKNQPGIGVDEVLNRWIRIHLEHREPIEEKDEQ